jgi:selenocysteine lyase/cysteine desulfurase
VRLPIEELRADTPGCAHVVHLNNAGAALMPQPVVDAVRDHLELEATIGGYEAAAAREEALGSSYDALARFLGCGRDEVAFIENATRAWDMAFYSIPFVAGDRILTAQTEYVSNYLAYLQMQKRCGVRIEVIPNDDTGQVSVPALEAMLDDDVKLVAITHVPTNGGLVNPAEAIGRVTRDAGVLYLLDACQSAGQIPLDVDSIGCDMLSATGRKYLRGPRGTGFLYVRRERLGELEPPFVDLHAAVWTAVDAYTLRDDARRFENWETNCAAKLGLSAAIRYADSLGMDAIRDRVQALGESLRRRLEAIDGVTVADCGETLCGIVTFFVAGLASIEIARALGRSGINVSVSEVAVARLDLEARGLPDLVRASVHYYNTDEELDRLSEAVARLAAG